MGCPFIVYALSPGIDGNSFALIPKKSPPSSPNIVPRRRALAHTPDATVGRMCGLGQSLDVLSYSYTQEMGQADLLLLRQGAEYFVFLCGNVRAEMYAIGPLSPWCVV